MRERCQHGTCPPSQWWPCRLRKAVPEDLHPQLLLSVFLVMAGGAAGLYTCRIHLAANFESHPLFKSPLLLLCLSALQYWSTALVMLTWVRWVMESIIRVSCSSFPEFQQFLLCLTVNTTMCCLKSQYPTYMYSSVENPPKMWSTFSVKGTSVGYTWLCGYRGPGAFLFLPFSYSWDIGASGEIHVSTK